MSDVFISYSRRDGQFVQRLNTALVEENRVVWVDWQGIPAGEDWWKEIQSGIENAETFVTVVSENWLASKICHQELAYALDHNKRIIPLIHQRIDGDIEKRVKGDWMDKPYEQMARDNWENLRNLNWIFVDSDEAFQTGFDRLLATIDEDQPHLKAHTRYLRRALEWKRSNENPSFLLLGDDLVFAENWLSDAKVSGKTPLPTDLQIRYIEQSRRLENEEIQREEAREKRLRQLRLASVVLAIVGGIAIVATLIAIPTSINAQNSNATSIAQISTADNILVTSTSVAEQVATGNADLANAVEAQDEALSQVTTIAEQVLTSDANLADAQQLVLVVAETLTPVAPTLTAVAGDLAGALNAQSEAIAQVTTIAEQVATSDANLADAEAQVLIAGETLTPVAPTLTAVAMALSGAIDAQVEAFAQVTTVAEQVATSDANLVVAVEAQGQAVSEVTEIAREIATSDANLSLVVETQNAAFDQVTQVANQIATSDANLVRAQDAENIALEKVAIAEETLTPVPVTLTAVAEVVQQTRNRLNISTEAGVALQRARNGYVGEALEIMNGVVEDYPDEVTAYLERATIYRQIGQPENAYADYTTALELEPDRAETYNVRALVLQDLGRDDDALADLTTAIELDPDFAPYYGNRASFYSQRGQLDLSLQDRNQAITLSPDDASTYTARANLYIQLDRRDDALADLTTAIDLDPNNADAYANRAGNYLQLEEYEPALDDINRAIELEPQQASFYNRRAFIYRGLGDNESALADMNRAIDLAPGDTIYYNNRYAIHRDMGNNESALADITRVMDTNPSPSSSDFLTRGLLYLELEQWDGAIADFTSYIELNPDDASGYDLRGTAYTGAERYNAALADYDYIIDELTADGRINITAVTNQGWTYYKMGDFERALENNNRVLNVVPDDVFALGNRGLIYLVRGQLDLAFDDYSAMADIQINNPPFPGTNIFELAIADINDIIADDPDNGTYYMMRGYLHYMNGNRILASTSWAEAANLGTQFLPEIDALR